MLLGLAIGLGAIALIAHKRRRWRRWAHYHHHHHGCHGGGGGDWDGRDEWHGWRGRHGFRGGTYHVMSMLGTTPGQEKVIREEADRMRERGRVARDEAAAARRDLAEVLRADGFDRVRFDAALGRVDAAWAQLKTALAESASRIHETLDARQRERLADLLASKRGPSYGPFR
jgi:Spy/CpxP family protein refolding chaperone